MINNQSSKMSIKTESQKNVIKKKTKKEHVLELVKAWQHSFDMDKKSLDDCYLELVQSYSRISGLWIEFDNSLSNILAELSKQIEFLQFNQHKQNELKKTLQIINQILLQKRFISERQYNKFKATRFSNTLQDSIYFLQSNLRNQGYLRQKFQSQNVKRIDYKNLSQQDKNVLVNLWEICMIVSMETFWRFVLKQKVDHKEIIVIFHVYDEVMKEDESVKEFKSEINSYIEEWYKRKRQQKVQPIRKIETSIVEYDHFLDLRAQDISVYLNKDRLAKFTKQYNQLTEYLTKICQQNIKFQPYGSFKSKFLVVKYSDIDVGLYFKSQKLKKRQNLIQVLDKICYAINQNKSLIPNCLFSKTYKFPELKIPFVKVVYNNWRGKNLQIVSSMDIIINNYEGIQNSNLLALYAEDEYLLKYCNLIKYWAVSRNLINLDRKMQGLSSYGVILMCLYYLIVTKQIPFLRKINGEYDIGRKQFNIQLNLLDNFIGFLQFYSFEYKDEETNTIKYGRFQKQKRMVCLMEGHENRKVYDNGLIINMYDFIDGSNPGRLRTHLQPKFNRIFQETLSCLYERSISFLQIVYSYEKQEPKINQNRPMPRRGNRPIG